MSSDGTGSQLCRHFVADSGRISAPRASSWKGKTSSMIYSRQEKPVPSATPGTYSLSLFFLFIKATVRNNRAAGKVTSMGRVLGEG